MALPSTANKHLIIPFPKQALHFKKQLRQKVIFYPTPRSLVLLFLPKLLNILFILYISLFINFRMSLLYYEIFSVIALVILSNQITSSQNFNNNYNSFYKQFPTFPTKRSPNYSTT